MSVDTPERVKSRPRRWEQDLLSSSRPIGGQEAVDEMARRIAEHNNRVRLLHLRSRCATLEDRMRIAYLIGDSARGLYWLEPA